MIDLFIILAGAIGLCSGLIAGIFWQTRRDEAALDQLAAENRQLRKRLAACDDYDPLDPDGDDNEKYCLEIERDVLADERQELRDRLAATLWREREHKRTIWGLQRFVDKNWYREVGEVDEYLMRDRSQD